MPSVADHDNVEEILFQPELNGALSALLQNAGPRHLCIAGPLACGQGLAAQHLSRARGLGSEPVLVTLIPAELSSVDAGEAIDKLRCRWDEASGGVLRVLELETLLVNPNAIPVLSALRELITLRSDVTLVVCGDRESVAQLHALSPDLFLQFHHARVRSFTTQQLLELMVRMLRREGFRPAPGFHQGTAALVEKVRPVGNLVNARIAAALARSGIKNATLASRAEVRAEDLDTASLRVVDTTLGSGFDELEQLIGLVDIKSTVSLWLANSELTARRAELGLVGVGAGQHMVFKGPAGTAKTTVARIVGRIMAETGVLPSGHLIEVQRGDLVGDTSEQVARRVVEAVKRAIGGVLFIDEAYTLTSAPGGPRDVSREVVDTLLKLMEDYRDEFVVIAAGYPTEMEQFLNSNPGLRSRFVRVLQFPSYDTTELLQILDHLAGRRGYVIDQSVHTQLQPRLALVSQYPGFGNGRHMRNLLENAIVRQGLRLGPGSSDDDLRTLTTDDFTEAALQNSL